MKSFAKILLTTLAAVVILVAGFLYFVFEDMHPDRRDEISRFVDRPLVRDILWIIDYDSNGAWQLELGLYRNPNKNAT